MQQEMTKYQAVVREASLSYNLLLVADKTRFVKLVEDLDNSYTQGKDRYPKIITGSCKFLTNCK